MSGPIAIVGGGSWGTALANAAAATGPALLWMRDAEAARATQQSRSNERYLPGLRIANGVTVTADESALGSARAVLFVVPAQAVRSTLAHLAGYLPAVAPIVVCAKGIERGTNAFLSDVVAETRPGVPVGILSGPSFAADVARGLPTAVTLAAPDATLAADLAAALSAPAFRVYFSTDVRGVEIGGAGKNVLAVAVGIVAGRGLGESAKAALTARGFAELTRFAVAFGAKPETLMGLSGLGDLVLTCGSAQSRNFSLGLRIGAGSPPAEASGGKLAEGAFTADALVALARAASVDMPVAEAVAAVLAGGLTVDAAIDALMTRPLRAEA
ncbi:MAG TPA: NAD(P)H-dependent glycerol-3-phosphate dehydrogenase [Enterovirga sp.]